MKQQGLRMFAMLALAALLLAQAVIAAPLPSAWRDPNMEAEAKWLASRSTLQKIIGRFPAGSTFEGYTVTVEPWKKFVDDYYDNASRTLGNSLHVLRARQRFSTSRTPPADATIQQLRAWPWGPADWTRVQYKSTPTRYGATWFRVETGNCNLPCSPGGGNINDILRGRNEGRNHEAIQALLRNHGSYDFSSQAKALAVEDYRFRILFRKGTEEAYEMSLDQATTTISGGPTTTSFEVELECTRERRVLADYVELFHLARIIENLFWGELTPDTTSKGGVSVRNSGQYYGLLFERNDFDGDDRGDLALAGGQWTDLPVAYYNGSGTFVESEASGAVDFPNFAFWGGNAGGVLISGDFYGRDGRTDLAMVGVGHLDWDTIPIAFGKERGTFGETNLGGSADSTYLVKEFQSWSTVYGAKILTGDFNRDGHTDIALTGPSNWATIPVAFSRGDGTWCVVNAPVTSFPFWASEAQHVLTGDFNGDGRTDILLTGNAAWGGVVRIAYSHGDNENGTFRGFEVTSHSIYDDYSFSADAASAGARVAVGDFNGDGQSDLALVATPWNRIRVALSTDDGKDEPDGTFDGMAFSGNGASDFASWASVGAKLITGDFNGDGRTDLGLTGVASWHTLPVALAHGRSGFIVQNRALSDVRFAPWSAAAHIRTNDFNNDGLTDVVLVASPGSGWRSLPLARGQASGGFTVTNNPQRLVPQRAQEAGARIIPREEP